jgi:hypothetical protein
MNRGTWMVILAAMLAGCSGSSSSNSGGSGSQPIVGSGVVVQAPRPVGAFHGVRLSSVGRVELSTSAQPSVVVEADDNVVEHVRTEVVGGVLEVGLDSGSYSDITLTVRVAAPALDLVELLGAGELAGTVGDVTSLRVALQGAGRVTLAGTAGAATIDLTGAGAFHGYDLLAGACTVRLTGTGVVEVTASDSLDAVVTGVGSVRYDGSPDILRSEVTGLGSIGRR